LVCEYGVEQRIQNIAELVCTRVALRPTDTACGFLERFGIVRGSSKLRD
jgi:hypothetical protein